ncbi:MAG: hypothetical protein WBY53_08615 [Acidobacteriaceae bacterium]
MNPGVFFAFTICFIVWVVFSSIRRYLIAKTKAGLQEKILQRIDSSEALTSLAANESGRRFLESITVEENKTSSPAGRILFGIQAGLVLLCFGIAMVILYHHINTYGSPGLIIIGTGAIGLGLGFLTAAAASLFVSRKLGLISREPRD